MNFVKKIYPKQTLSVLDVGAEAVVVLVAKKKEDGSFQVLGAGDSAVSGIEQGVITHLGDAVEAVVQAIRKAEHAAGIRVSALYYNFDDPEAQSVKVRGSKNLSGEGEIRRSDVEQACQMAKRLVAHFERTIVYFKELGFVIDEKDYVLNPLGVFGNKLEVIAHAVQARSRLCEEWSRLMERANVEKPVSVFSAWSTACGILPKKDRMRKRVIVDAGRDLTSVFLFENNGITDYSVCPTTGAVEEIGMRAAEAAREIMKKNEGVEQIFLAGDHGANDSLERVLREELGVLVQRPSPLGIENLNHPRYVSVVGLLHAADELEKKSLSHQAKKGLISDAKDRVVSYINEYF